MDGLICFKKLADSMLHAGRLRSLPTLCYTRDAYGGQTGARSAAERAAGARRAFRQSRRGRLFAIDWTWSTPSDAYPNTPVTCVDCETPSLSMYMYYIYREESQSNLYFIRPRK